MKNPLGNLPAWVSGLLIGLAFLWGIAVLWGIAPHGQLTAQSLFSFDEDIPDPVAVFDTRIIPASARPGEHVRLQVTANLAKGWYMYSVIAQGGLAPPPSKLAFQSADLQLQGPVYETNPTRKVDKVFEMPLAYHPLAARFYQNLVVPVDAQAAQVEVAGTIRYQTCNDRLCLPPRTDTLKAGMTIESGGVREPYAYMLRTIDYVDPSGTIRGNPDTLEGVLSGGMGAFLLLAVGFGLLALLTPCVFPMIPVTVSFFAGVSDQGRAASFRLAVIFGLGMIVTYTGLGLILTFLLGAAGVSQFATSPWVNILVAVFFIGFALSLMGVFETALPATWINKLDEKSRSLKGTLGVLLMGVAFTATSFTCTMPFVGTLLVAATQGAFVWPLVGMLVFATVFAIPFFLLALFPGLVTHLRGRSGNWLIQVKVALGLVELMAALKFVSNADLIWRWGIFDRDIVLAAWAGLALLTALMLTGVLPWPGVTITRRPPLRMATAAAFLAVAVYLGSGLTGRDLGSYIESYLPPPLEGSASAAAMTARGFVSDDVLKELPWYPSLQAGLIQAQAQAKPIFIDFTGYTCVNCRWMEKKVFAEKSVFETFRDDFVLVQLYTDGGPNGEENQRLQIERFRTIALPYYVILSPDNAVLARRSGIMADPADFKDWLDLAKAQMHPSKQG